MTLKHGVKKSNNQQNLKFPKFPDEDLGEPMKIITNIDKLGHWQRNKIHLPLPPHTSNALINLLTP